MMYLSTSTEKLSDNSEVSDVYLFDPTEAGGRGIVFHACSAADALTFQGELLRIIKAYTVEEVRES